MINREKKSTTCIFSIQVFLMGELTTLSIVEQVASHLREEILHNRNATSAWLSLQRSVPFHPDEPLQSLPSSRIVLAQNPPTEF